MGFLSWVESTAYAQWILTGLYGWPIMLSIHAIGLAIVFGIIFVLDLRLLGLYGSIPLTEVNRLMAVAWVGIALNVFTGLSLFTTQATSYVTSGVFLLKIGFIVLGVVNLVYTQKILQREAEGWERSSAVARTRAVLSLSSIACWTIALVTARLIAYV